MTAGSYAGGTFGLPFGLGGGLFIDNHGRAYPQFYGGTPGLSLSGGYTPDLEGLLTGPSVSWSPGAGAVRYNVGGNADTIGVGASTAGVGTPSVGVTHGFGPFEASKDYSKPWMTPAIRDSAASARVPSRYNIFEYGFPDSEAGLPTFDERWNSVGRSLSDRQTSTELLRKPRTSASHGAGSSPAAPVQPQTLSTLIMDHIRRLNEQDADKSPVSVFDAGASSVPFVSDDGASSFADRFDDRRPIRTLSRLDRR